ncbi:MAG: hypothetical protein B6242_03445 [Anaerolineaceae bacterium 4572_78]|nr:MAG: hypothetical protein B6242_03445 [Anaerolineaceae bacterium 4572_78]
MSITHFDPTWRDDVFDVQALETPIVLPDSTSRSDHVWIKKHVTCHETIFEHYHVYDTFREITTVLKHSDMAQFYRATDEHGNELPAGHVAFDYMFPPKAWMSDMGEERCTMFNAAKLAKGNVLVGGLGLAVYPQFALALNRPVESFTIIERDTDIIDFVTQAWLHTNPEHAKKTTIIEGTIEKYLHDTEKSFDTIYLDTWEDADPRFLAHVNYLIQLASQRCTADGMIQCWGYSRMIETFVSNMIIMTKKNFPWHLYNLDPVLHGFVEWLNAQEHDPTELEIIQNARTCALTIRKSIEEYDRHRCFTAFGTSLSEAYRNMALARKVEPSTT